MAGARFKKLSQIVSQARENVNKRKRNASRESNQSRSSVPRSTNRSPRSSNDIPSVSSTQNEPPTRPNSLENMSVSATTSRIALSTDSLGRDSPTTPTQASPNSSSSGTARNIGARIRRVVTKRGVTKGINLRHIVNKGGKIKIRFKPGEKVPAQNSGLFSEGVGVAVRTCADLSVRLWRNIPLTNQLLCRMRLLEWFEIEDMDSPRVARIMNGHFQKAYKNWRWTLAKCYKDIVADGKNPRDRSPRKEVLIDDWHKVCDWLESDKFKALSEKNTANRFELPFNHLTGRTPYVVRFREKDDECKIEFFKDTHRGPNGKWVNDKAETAYNQMVAFRDGPLEEGETRKSVDEIMELVLGRRSGYQKGMGHGVEVSRGTRYSSSFQHDNELKDKLSLTQNELDTAKDKIISLTDELDEQKGKLEEQKEQLEEQLEEQRGLNTSFMNMIKELQAKLEKMEAGQI